jgi:DNA polymerase-3 subunit epsilon/CBS domain-containing protein
MVERTGLSGLPLRLVPAVVMDTETTGLNTVTDRIVEIAAVRISDGSADTANPFQQLINPGLAIPAASSAIHTITDADVADANKFSDMMPALSRWTGNAVVIGYSIGFDLAILHAEHERHGLPWTAPRSLDVRHLVELVTNDLPEQSLDTAAAWLGVEVTDRHRALGDAITALNVFQALLPKLKQRGITTLAQVERACLEQSSRRHSEKQAGWHDVVRPGRVVPAEVSNYARIDSYAYRHRVADIMHTPPLRVSGDISLATALSLAMRKKVSSIFVDPGAEHDDTGILTERDMLRAIDANGASALATPVSKLAVYPLITIAAEEFAYRAIAMMAGRGFRHLGVTGPGGELAGALSARDLLKQRASTAVLLGDDIDSAGSTQELGKVWAGLTTVVRALVSEDVDPRDIAAVISRELRALTQRACELGEQAMQQNNKGSPPQPYAMFVLGSGGRGESLLAMDQDNAIVFHNGEPGSDTDRWFAELGTMVADTLNDAGVSYCQGGIMASNGEWRMDLTHWRDVISQWLSKSQPEDILNADIFFDAKSVHGDHALLDALRLDALRSAQNAHGFLNAMQNRAGDFHSPMGWFGRWKLEEGRIDLKRAGLMPLFSAARVLALRYGIAEPSTPGRFEAARTAGVEAAHVIDDLIEAHKILLYAILRQQLRDIETGVKLGNSVDPTQMSGHDAQQIRWAIDQVPKVRDLLGLPTLA